MDIILYAANCPQGQEKAAAYRLLELAVCREYGLEKLPEIARREAGKPWFPEHPHICFNVSHTHGAAVCAIHDQEIGVDVEKLRPAPRRVAAEMEDEAFFRLWTAQEASIKREGKDWRSLLSRPTPDECCRCVENILPGWIVTVCPTENSPIRAVRIEL